jgi:ketosteroid isomerase-like protein
MFIMDGESKRDRAAAVMHRINQAWLDGRVEDLALIVHPDIAMALRGFAGRIQGREDFLAGFRDFCQSAKVHKFHQHDQQIDVAGDVAVVTFRYEMVYERSGERFSSSGRDFWVFQNQGTEWIAVWRTMLDAEENPA